MWGFHCSKVSFKSGIDTCSPSHLVVHLVYLEFDVLPRSIACCDTTMSSRYTPDARVILSLDIRIFALTSFLCHLQRRKHGKCITSMLQRNKNRKNSYPPRWRQWETGNNLFCTIKDSTSTWFLPIYKDHVWLILTINLLSSTYAAYIWEAPQGYFRTTCTASRSCSCYR